MIAVLCFDNSVIAFSSGSDALKSPAMQGFICFRSLQISASFSRRGVTPIFHLNNQHFIDTADDQIDKTQISLRTIYGFKGIIQQVVTRSTLRTFVCCGYSILQFTCISREAARVSLLLIR